MPEISLTDPELLTTMPPELTAHTGLDALSHAIESCVSEACDFLSKGHAVAAIEALAAPSAPGGPGSARPRRA